MASWCRGITDNRTVAICTGLAGEGTFMYRSGRQLVLSCVASQPHDRGKCVVGAEDTELAVCVGPGSPGSS